MIEKAIGIDTTTRWQTVWQVKTLKVESTTTCGSRPEEWEKIIRPSTARLSTKTVGVPSEDDPCLLPPSGGYRGLENRLYRVEWHDDAALQEPAAEGDNQVKPGRGFKWSRDNASIATSVTKIDADKITVSSLGRDLAAQFHIGDWVEITDDWREFSDKPGDMARIKDIMVDSRVLVLASPIAGGDFKPADLSRHTRIIRWDQQGRVLDTQGNLLVDLNDPDSKGVIPIPSSGVSVVLEHGVQVTLIGSPHLGDYWVFAACTADRTVETLDNMPPKGIHRHYCRLAIATIPNADIRESISDCRTLWPPDMKGGDCECTICVSAESHEKRTLTIQMAIGKVIDSGGGTVCLGPGTYDLGESPETALKIEKARSLKIRGQGALTNLLYKGKGPALRIDHSNDVTIEGLRITARDGDGISPVVSLSNSLGTKVERNLLARVGDSKLDVPAIGVAGILIGIEIRDNALFAPVGVGSIPIREVIPAGMNLTKTRLMPLATLSFHVEGNAIFGAKRGISLVGTSLHFLETRISKNFIYDCPEGGIVATGYAEAYVDVQANEILARGLGIIAGTDGARISENEIGPVTKDAGMNGIVLSDGINLDGLDRCMVFGNRIRDMGGNGIAITGKIKSAMIKNNIIQSADGGGIVMDDKSTGQHITIENNQLFQITSKQGDRKTPVTAIRVINSSQVQVQNNTIDGVGQLVQSPIRAGIQLIACGSARVMGNDIVNIGPMNDLNHTAGVDCWGTFGNLEISNNTIRRSRESHSNDDRSNWMGISVSANNNIPPGPNLIFTSKNAFVFLLAHIIAQPVQSRREASTNIDNNTMDVYGGVPAIQVLIDGACMLSHNRVRFRGRTDTLVEVRADQLIATGNDLWATETFPALSCVVPDPGLPVSILGNITRGPIKIQGVDLGAPWKDLNVVRL